jgi:hypothetical protein
MAGRRRERTTARTSFGFINGDGGSLLQHPLRPPEMRKKKEDP